MIEYLIEYVGVLLRPDTRVVEPHATARAIQIVPELYVKHTPEQTEAIPDHVYPVIQSLVWQAASALLKRRVKGLEMQVMTIIGQGKLEIGVCAVCTKKIWSSRPYRCRD